ncbi:hypothetical protein HNW13_023160 [Shewanella sp. BF02_Schw]|uniref:hypothetical protein n=1 Tax=Shewanella sp. BF02_Schw TaxID=394908 RepID=UPI001780670B|nr:hypothetical protein [Shewanella sp. BF02_Schw]MBO1898644.1 hypothetical protein [Shewanella sp. BF02_Schw]
MIAEAVTESALKTVLDQEPLEWANSNLTLTGWALSEDYTGTTQEQRDIAESPARDNAIFAELNASYDPMMGNNPIYSTEILNEIYGNEVPAATDTDGDHVEDAFDMYVADNQRWQDTDNDGITDSEDDDDRNTH